MTFDWDEANIAHLARHRISPHEAEQVLQNDPLELDYGVVDDEDRFREVGETNAGRVLVVVVSLRGDQVRVVTGWEAPAAIRNQYLRERSREWRLQ